MSKVSDQNTIDDSFYTTKPLKNEDSFRISPSDHSVRKSKKKKSLNLCCCFRKNKNISPEEKELEEIRQRLGRNFKDITEKETLLKLFRKKKAQRHWRIVQKWYRAMKVQSTLHLASYSTMVDKAKGSDVDPEKIATQNMKTFLFFYYGNKNLYLMPNGIFNSIWDSITNGIVVCSMIITPLVLIFDYLWEDFRIADLVFDIVLTIDIILNFFTAYSDDIKFQTSNKKIAKHYLKTYFIFDIVSTIPTLVTYEMQEIYFLKLLRFANTSEVLGHVNLTLETLNEKVLHLRDTTIDGMLNFIKFICVLGMTTHVCASFWLYLGVHYEDGWHIYEESNGYFLSDPDLYLYSYYWIVTTLTSVGYGDCSGNNEREYLFQMLLELLGLAFFSFLMGSVTVYFEKIVSFSGDVDEKTEEREHWIMQLDKVFPEKKIPLSLYNLIDENLKYTSHMDHRNIVENSSFFYLLPPKFQVKLSFHLFKNCHEQFKSFFEVCEDQLTAQILVNMKPIMIDAFTVLESFGDITYEVYFIKSGIVEVTLSDKSEKILELPAGSYFGEMYSLLDMRPTVNFIARTDVEIYSIPKDIFLNLVSKFPVSEELLKGRALKRWKLLRIKELQMKGISKLKQLTSMRAFERKNTSIQPKEKNKKIEKYEKMIHTQIEEDQLFKKKDVLPENIHVQQKFFTTLSKINIIEKNYNKIKNLNEEFSLILSFFFQMSKNPYFQNDPQAKQILLETLNQIRSNIAFQRNNQKNNHPNNKLLPPFENLNTIEQAERCTTPEFEAQIKQLLDEEETKI